MKIWKQKDAIRHEYCFGFVWFCLNNNMRLSCKSLAESQWLRKRDAIESNSKFYLCIESFRRMRLRLASSFLLIRSVLSFWHRHHSQFISIKVLFDVCRRCCCFFESCHYYPLLLLKHKFQTLVKHYILSGCFFFSRWIALGFASLVRLHTHSLTHTPNWIQLLKALLLRSTRSLRPFCWFYFPFFVRFFPVTLSHFYPFFSTLVRRSPYFMCMRTSLFCIVYVSIFLRYNLKWA